MKIPAPKIPRQPRLVYLASDKTKTPVVLKDQKQGTQLVIVGPHSRDINFTMGKVITNDPTKVKESMKKRQAAMKAGDKTEG